MKNNPKPIPAKRDYPVIPASRNLGVFGFARFRRIATLFLAFGILLGVTAQAEAQRFPPRVGVGAFPASTDQIHLYYTVSLPIADLVLPGATGGVAPLVYDLDFEDLGLTFDPVSRTLSGTPTIAGAGADGNGFLRTYSVDDANRGFDLIDVYLTICEEGGAGAGAFVCSPPPYTELEFSEPLGDLASSIGTEGFGRQLPAATGGTGAVPFRIYSLAYSRPTGRVRYRTNLPDWMRWNIEPDSDTNSDNFGMPLRNFIVESTAVAGIYPMRYRVRDAASRNYIDTFFTLTVTTDPVFNNPSTIQQQYTVGVPIDALTFPQAAGNPNFGILTYALTGPAGGNLPPG